MEIAKAREQDHPKKASDFVRDPSDIQARDKNGRAVVSKFRQI